MNKIKNKLETLTWVDLEMTGLDPLEDKILEIAVVITDIKLKTIGTLGSIVVSEPESVLTNMNREVTDIHKLSGLIEEVRNSKIHIHEAEQKLLNFVKKFTKEKKSPLCGNSIATDRAFIQIHMPKFFSFLHYRTIDVSTLKQLFANWLPNTRPFEKSDKHRALVDIHESIEELKYYKKYFFKNKMIS